MLNFLSGSCTSKLCRRRTTAKFVHRASFTFAMGYPDFNEKLPRNSRTMLVLFGSMQTKIVTTTQADLTFRQCKAKNKMKSCKCHNCLSKPCQMTLDPKTLVLEAWLLSLVTSPGLIEDTTSSRLCFSHVLTHQSCQYCYGQATIKAHNKSQFNFSCPHCASKKKLQTASWAWRGTLLPPKESSQQITWLQLSQQKQLLPTEIRLQEVARSSHLMSATHHLQLYCNIENQTRFGICFTSLYSRQVVINYTKPSFISHPFCQLGLYCC